jgi:hypothetical protein
VLLSADAYERLRALDTRRAYPVSDLPDDITKAILEANAPAASMMFDREIED